VRLAVFGLGVMPYITSSIIIQLLSTVIPKLEEWRDQGAVGQKKITQTTRYLTVALALMQSSGWSTPSTATTPPCSAPTST
jgi:preprotein translocase subunit SecY